MPWQTHSCMAPNGVIHGIYMQAVRAMCLVQWRRHSHATVHKYTIVFWAACDGTLSWYRVHFKQPQALLLCPATDLDQGTSAINHCPLWCLGPDVCFANLRKSLIQQLTPLCCAELLIWRIVNSIILAKMDSRLQKITIHINTNKYLLNQNLILII